MTPWHHDPPAPRGTGALFSAPGVLVSLIEHGSKALSVRLPRGSTCQSTSTVEIMLARPLVPPRTTGRTHARHEAREASRAGRKRGTEKTWLEAIWFQAHAGGARARTGVARNLRDSVRLWHLAPTCTMYAHALPLPGVPACPRGSPKQASRWVRCDTAARRRRVTMAELGREVSQRVGRLGRGASTLAGLALSCLCLGCPLCR